MKNDILTELKKKYSTCPKGGNDKIGVEVDKRIKHVCTRAIRDNEELIAGICEVYIPERRGNKYLPLLELKEKSGVKNVDSIKEIENWLNTTEGHKWAIKVPAANLNQLECLISVLLM